MGRLCFFLLCVLRAASAASDSPDQGWPRPYTDGNAKLVLHQPQVDSWIEFKKLSARFAVSLTAHKGAPPAWGVLSIQYSTTVNLKARTVQLEHFTVSEVRYPSAKDATEAREWEALTIKLLPAEVTTVTSTWPAVWAGAVAVIDVEEVTWNEVATEVPNITEETFVKFVPVMVTEVPPPVLPEVGPTPLTVGGLAV